MNKVDAKCSYCGCDSISVERSEVGICKCDRCGEVFIDKTLPLKLALATANARVAEQQKPSYKAEFDCVYEKLKAEERLSAHYKQKVEQAEAKLNETYTDENGTVWTRPTAEAYCLICKAYDAWKTKAEQAEARIIGLEKELSDCKKMEDVAYQLRESLRGEISSANARIAELEYKLMAQTETALQEIARREQAEAQCAAMRLRFEKYVRENCKLIRHSVADGLDKPDEVEGKCGGYCQNLDEPHQICQECIAAYDPDAEYNDEVTDAGTAILAENRRMREALEQIAKMLYYDEKSELAEEALKGGK